MGIDPWEGQTRLQDLYSKIERFIAADEGNKAEYLGELLFNITALSHDAKIDAESILRQTLNRFRAHFLDVESQVLKSGRALPDLSDQEKKQIIRQFNTEHEDDGIQ